MGLPIPTARRARPPGCGIIELEWHEKTGWIYCRERVKAQRSEAPRISETEMIALLNSTYHRFWRRELKEAA